MNFTNKKLFSFISVFLFSFFKENLEKVFIFLRKKTNFFTKKYKKYITITTVFHKTQNHNLL
jgi:hypothetical protein